ncbi:hypothetical protein MKX03_033135 [Papaver bracteatum]|nr:hypothetical protein MKX03_033135 [Papaver bracteatum]
MVKTKTDVIIQCLEEQNPPPQEQRIENKTGHIQIKVTKNLKQTIRYPGYPDDVEPLPIHGDPEFADALEHDKIKKLCLCANALRLVFDMLCWLEVPSDRLVQKKISRFVVETAKSAISERAKSFFVYVELEVITKDSDDNDVDIISENEDADMTSDGETISYGEDMNMPSDRENEEMISGGEDIDMPSDGEIIRDHDEQIISDDEFTSDNNDINMIVELSVDDAYENRKIGASRSAIEGLKRESYSYERGGDDHTRNNAAANTCVICMDEFEAGTVVRYMPCSHIFHEVCLVRYMPCSHIFQFEVCLVP